MKRSIRTLVAPVLLALAGPAAAQVERCVRTVAEFNSAWVLADSDPVVIKIATGTCDLANSAVGGQMVMVDDDVTMRAHAT
jgi:hypothetical protein